VPLVGKASFPSQKADLAGKFSRTFDNKLSNNTAGERGANRGTGFGNPDTERNKIEKSVIMPTVRPALVANRTTIMKLR